MLKLIGIVVVLFAVLAVFEYVTWDWPKLNDKGRALWESIKAWFKVK